MKCLTTVLPFKVDQTALVRELLSRSKDIGGAAPIIPPEQFESSSKDMKRIRFRWFLLDTVAHAGLLAQARARYAEVIAGPDNKRAARLQQLVDALDLAQLVDEVCLLDEVRWFLFDDAAGTVWLEGCRMESIPVLSTPFGVWLGWHLSLEPAYASVVQYSMAMGQPLTARVEATVGIEDIKKVRQGESEDWYREYFTGLQAHLPLVLETEIGQFLEFSIKNFM